MLSKYSVKKPYTVIVGIILVIVLGVISFRNMTTDLLPSMNLPYVVVYTPYVGATPEQVELDVTRPMESAFATLTDVKRINSSSRDNVSVVIMEFNNGANMDTALIEISSKLDQLRGEWDDGIGAPVTMKLNPDMLPVAILSVAHDDMDILALSDYVNDELAPAFEALNGVASASASGIITQQIDVTIEQSRIDALNSAILREVDAELADVEQQLNDAQAQLSDGKQQLARAKRAAFAQIDDALAAIDQGAEQIDPAIAQLTQQRAALVAQRDELAAVVRQLEGLTGMDDGQKALLQRLALRLADLRQQLADLDAQAQSADEGVDEAVAAQRSEAMNQRDALVAERSAAQQYLDDLSLVDADGLRGEISALEAGIAANESAVAAAQSELEQKQGQRDAAQARIEELNARIAALEATPTEAPADTEAPAPTAEGESGVLTPDSAQASADPDGVPEATEGSGADGEESSGLASLRGLTGAQAESGGLDELRDQLAAAQAELSALDGDIAAKSGEIDGLNAQLDADRAALESKRAALSELEAEGGDVQSRQAEARRQIAALDARIAALDVEIAGIDALMAGDEALEQRIATLREQIQAIEDSDAYKALDALSDPTALDAQYAQAQAGLSELDAGIAQIDGMLEKLNQGVIPGGFIDGIDEDTRLSDAKAQLESARSAAVSGFEDAEAQLAEGEAELVKARREFNEKRDEALESAGLDGVITVQTVSGLIGAQNFSMPAGYVYDAENDRVLVRVGNQFATLDELKQMKLFNLGLDSIDEVRLLDVASVALTDDRDDVFTKLDGTDGILLSIDKQSTYSTADVADTILDRAAALMAADSGLHIVDLMNQGEYIDIIVDSVLDNLLTGGALAILILLLFLMDLRPTITVAFSIPVSVVIAFVCMYFSGITLNVLSLSGLSLGIGMLVDNSIVAIENIYRLHEEEGMPLLRSCVEGVKSVSGALFASTLTTICVFLPIVFVQGMARDLFADMGLAITYSLLASLLVAMTVVPAMSSFLMKRSKPHRHRIFSRLQQFYLWLLRGALRIKPLVLLAALALLAYSALQVSHMGISFMPEVNSRQMSAELTPNPELSTEQQRALAMDIMDDMLAIEGVESVGLMGGGDMLSGLSGGSGMSYYIIVDEDAGRPNADIAAEMSAIGEKRDADLAVSASTMDISMLTGSGISVEITGEDIETLQAIALDVAEIARGTEGVADVDDGLEDAVPEMRIEVDKERAIDQGLTTAQVYQFVAQKLVGRIEISQVRLDGKSLSINLIEGRNSSLRPEDLEDLEIEVAGEEEHKLVRIGDIADIRETESLSTINRASQRRMVTVSFGIADGYSTNLVSDDFAAKLAEYETPAGYSVDLAGENETVMGIMEDLVFMVLIAILLIFLIMVAQFQSFKSPIIVIFTIPLAFTGGLLALLLTGLDLSIVSMLGFLVLSGVVVNNGIVFIDCVNQLRIGGMEKKEALLEAGRQRLRPILMTAMTTILGMSTMALGHGTGAEMMQPMAVVSVGGLTYSTLMTLFIVPVLYDIFNGKKMRAREILMIKEAAGLNGDEVLDGVPAAPISPEAGSPALAASVPPEVPVPGGIETSARAAMPEAPAGKSAVVGKAAAPAKPLRIKLSRR